MGFPTRESNRFCMSFFTLPIIQMKDELVCLQTLRQYQERYATLCQFLENTEQNLMFVEKFTIIAFHEDN